MSGIREAVAAEVRAMMGRRNVRQHELAVRLGRPDVWVSRRLKADVPMSLEDLESLARVLNCGIADLLPHLDSNQKPAGYFAERYAVPLGAW